MVWMGVGMASGLFRGNIFGVRNALIRYILLLSKAYLKVHSHVYTV